MVGGAMGNMQGGVQQGVQDGIQDANDILGVIDHGADVAQHIKDVARSNLIVLQGGNTVSNAVMGGMGNLQGGNTVSNMVMGGMGNLQGGNVASNFVLGDMGMLQGGNTVSNMVMGGMGNLVTTHETSDDGKMIKTTKKDANGNVVQDVTYDPKGTSGNVASANSDVA